MKIGVDKGFTLVELSIVIVIIGLIIGGVFKGSELLKNSELKAFVSEVNEYKAAVTTFKDIYKYLPGDMVGATTYWASAADGDGDSTIDAETSNEPFSAMQEMQLAGLIDGNFTGTWGTGFTPSTATLSGNIPVSSTGRAGAMIYIKCCSSTDYARTISFNNYVNIFSIYTTNNDYRAGIVTPIEANNIDTKIDDGIPDYGFVGGSGSYTGAAYAATGCYSGTGATSTYDTAVAGNKNAYNCQMQFAYDWD